VSKRISSWAAGFAMVAALAAAPVAIATIQTPAVSQAEVCADAGGRHVDVVVARTLLATPRSLEWRSREATRRLRRPPRVGRRARPDGVPYYTPGDAPCN